MKPPPLRIAHVIPDFGLGGIQKAGCVLAAEMAAAGHTCFVIGFSPGPRFQETPITASCRHVVAGMQDVPRLIASLNTDVVHIHNASYQHALLQGIDAASPGTLKVSTPVFGRPPRDRTTLSLTRTCCVGVYTLYRLAKWLGLEPTSAVLDGFAFVPMTPYSPPDPAPSQTLPRGRMDCRRHLGLSADGFYVGRIGRDTLSKWSDRTPQLVDRMLTSDERLRWLSIGYPEALNREALRDRWGDRFINHPETADSRTLTAITRALDIQVFFSRFGECFASSICEAAGEGVPTIALSTPFFDNGQAEQVIDGVTGYLVGSVSSACGHITSLLSSPSSLGELQQSAAAYAHRNWHVSLAANNLVDLYRYWMNGTAPPHYVATMHDMVRDFASLYRTRMTALAGDRLGGQLGLRIGLMLYENWTTFVAGRFVRRCLLKR